jgi:putative ABC transport system ATP-binding protein
MASSVDVIEVQDVTKSFMVGTQQIDVLKGITFKIKMGDFVVVLGPSGCGKSTILHIVLGLEVPSSGTVTFLGENIYDNTDEDYRSNFRKKHIGMIYQQPNWIKSMNVEENVAFPLILLGMEKLAAIEKAHELLRQVNLEPWAKYIPTELSSGQQQRIALARGLANNPEIIIADEPTGNLDFQAGQAMMQLLADLNAQKGKTIVMVTHDLEYLRFAKSAVRILDGQVKHVYNTDEIKELMKEIRSKRGV